MKKALVGFIIALMFSIFSVSYTFAAGNFQNDVRNVVGGAENVVENAGSAIGRTVQSGVNTLGNGARDIGGMAQSSIMTTNNNSGYTSNNGYTTTRTSATSVSDDLASSTTMYTWVIIGVTAVGIGVLLWSYFAQNSKNNMYIDSDE